MIIISTFSLNELTIICQLLKSVIIGPGSRMALDFVDVAVS